MLTHELTPRDAAVVQVVGRLNQVASTHIQDLLFNDVSRVSRDRSLARLVKGDYLMRVGRRAVGPNGGNSPIVYQLGRKGWWYLDKGGKYWGRRAVSEHSLLISDLFTKLVDLDRRGVIKLLAMEPEYSAGHSRADLFVDVGVPAIRKRRKYFVEVQLSARPDVITKKLRAYAATFDNTQADIWPYLVFAVRDDYHRTEIARQVPRDMRQWVRVLMIDDFTRSVVAT